MIRIIPYSILMAGILGCTAILAPSAQAAPIPDDLKIGGFALGCQAWTFHTLSVFDAIDRTSKAGGKTIEFFPGQSLSPDRKDVKFDHNASPEVIAEVKAKCAAAKIQPIGYGVVSIPKNEADARKIFEFAKTMGMLVVVTESVDSLDISEKLVKEYDIKLAFHDHPKRPDQPDYKMWDPNYIVQITKGRDPRIGSCADTGHWARSGLRPLDCVKILKGRIISSHLKDLNSMTPGAHDVPYGKGVCDVKCILDEYKAQGFEGPISIEYESNPNDNTAEVKECIDFVRAYGEQK